jgi:hypothetical protein
MPPEGLERACRQRNILVLHTDNCNRRQIGTTLKVVHAKCRRVMSISLVPALLWFTKAAGTTACKSSIE